VLVAGGGVLFSIDEDDDPTPQSVDQHYYDTALGGIALAAAGAAAVGVGVYLLVQKPSERRAPTVSVLPGGGVIGWAGRF
jgi:hypothetical protein